MERGAQVVVRKLTLRASARTAEAQRLGGEIARELQAADLHPRELPPSAILIVRRLAGPPARAIAGGSRPGAEGVRGGPAGRRAGAAAWPDGVDWESGTRRALARLAAEAARPVRGELPHDAAAVRFRDPAEMTAALLCDVAAGEAPDRWWWQCLSPGRDALHDLSEAFAHEPRHVPAAVSYLIEWGKAEEVALALSPGEARSVLRRLCETFGLAKLLPVLAGPPGGSAGPQSGGSAGANGRLGAAGRRGAGAESSEAGGSGDRRRGGVPAAAEGRSPVPGSPPPEGGAMGERGGAPGSEVGKARGVGRPLSLVWDRSAGAGAEADGKRGASAGTSAAGSGTEGSPAPELRPQGAAPWKHGGSEPEWAGRLGRDRAALLGLSQALARSPHTVRGSDFAARFAAWWRGELPPATGERAGSGLGAGARLGPGEGRSSAPAFPDDVSHRGPVLPGGEPEGKLGRSPRPNEPREGPGFAKRPAYPSEPGSGERREGAFGTEGRDGRSAFRAGEEPGLGAQENALEGARPAPQWGPSGAGWPGDALDHGSGGLALRPAGDPAGAAGERVAGKAGDGQSAAVERRTTGAPAWPFAIGGMSDDPWLGAAEFETELGGLLYLVNAMRRLGLPACFEEAWRLDSELGAWGCLQALGIGLLAASPGLAGSPDREGTMWSDPIWGLLAELEGRPPGEPLGAGVVDSGEFRPPAGWPPAAEGAERRDVRDEATLAALTPRIPIAPALRRWIACAVPHVAAYVRSAAGPLGKGDFDPAGLLLVRGRVYASATHVDLVAGLDEISLAARIAGLDANPGWEPRFARVIQFHFR